MGREETDILICLFFWIFIALHLFLLLAAVGVEDGGLVVLLYLSIGTLDRKVDFE